MLIGIAFGLILWSIVTTCNVLSVPSWVKLDHPKIRLSLVIWTLSGGAYGYLISLLIKGLNHGH